MDDRFRMVLRVLVVGVGYLVAIMVAPDRVVARLMMWSGSVILGWLAVDRLTRWAHERSGMMIAGAVVLGLGLGGVGLYLALR